MRWAPIVDLAWRKTSEARRFRAELARVRGDLDAANAELAVQRRRTARWRQASYELAAGNPAARRVLAFQAMSDDIADADEIEPEKRNAPRSCP